MWKRMVNDKTEQVGWAQFMQDFGFYPISFPLDCGGRVVVNVE